MSADAHGRARRGRHGRRDRGLAVVRFRAGARDRGRARHHVPRQHVPGVELGVERAVRAARGGRALGRARADVRRAARPRRSDARPSGSPVVCSASRSSCSARSRCSGSCSHPWLARALTAGDRNAHDRGPAARARDVPAALLRAAAPAVRVRRGRHRGARTRAGGSRSPPPRRSATPLVMVVVPRRLPGAGRRAPRLRPHRHASVCCSRSRAPAASSPSSASLSSPAGGPGSGCGRAARAGIRRCAGCCSSRSGACS